MTRWSALLCLALLLTPASNRAWAEHPPAGKIRIADQGGDDFPSIQAAIDAAPDDATILVGAGRYDERLKIGKPIKLVGAGPDQTIIGPTAVAREEETTPERTVKPAAAIVKIENVGGVDLRSLRVTSPGILEPDAGSDGGSNAIELRNAGLRMTDCVVVGCVVDGVNVTGASNLEIDDCLIGGCWNNGVTATGPNPMRLKITNSDVRNCYRKNLFTYANDILIVEGCRISGSAGWGIHCSSQSTIVRNAIFENNKVGIQTNGSATIEQNLIYKNRMRGVVLWPPSNSRLQSNLFIENSGGVCACGKSEPQIFRNVFVGGNSAVEYGPFGRAKGLEPATKRYEVRENFFWKIGEPVVRHGFGANMHEQTEVIHLPAGQKNRVEDPQITINAEGRAVLAGGSPARQIDFAGITAVSLKSRWPLTDEERAMIPEDGSREVLQWNLRPVAVDR